MCCCSGCGSFWSTWHYWYAWNPLARAVSTWCQPVWVLQLGRQVSRQEWLRADTPRPLLTPCVLLNTCCSGGNTTKCSSSIISTNFGAFPSQLARVVKVYLTAFSLLSLWEMGYLCHSIVYCSTVQSWYPISVEALQHCTVSTASRGLWQDLGLVPCRWQCCRKRQHQKVWRVEFCFGGICSSYLSDPHICHHAASGWDCKIASLFGCGALIDAVEPNKVVSSAWAKVCAQASCQKHTLQTRDALQQSVCMLTFLLHILCQFKRGCFQEN